MLRALFIGMVCVVPAGVVMAADETAEIKGMVTYKGKPLPQGKITFHPAKGKAVTATLAKDGAFAAKGVPTGALAVTVESYREVEKDKVIQKISLIPPKYVDPKTSGLKLDAREGAQVFDVVLD